MPPKVAKGKGGKAAKGGKGGKGGKDADPNDPEVLFARAAAKLNQEKQNLAVELAFQKDRMLKEHALATQLGEKVEELNDRLARTTVDSDDILTHKQREIKLKLERVRRLEAQVAEVGAALEEANAAMRTMREEHEANLERLSDAVQLLEDKNTLEDVVRQQDGVLASQEETIERQVELLEARDATIAQQQIEIEELGLRAAATTRLTIAFGDPWMIRKESFRLRGDVPVDRDDNAMTMLSARCVCLYGGQIRGDMALSVVNLDDRRWVTGCGEVADDSMADVPRVRMGHAVVAVSKSKAVVVGGRVGPAVFDSSLHLLQSEQLKWQQPRLKGTGLTREYFATCMVGVKMYLFGGFNTTLMNDMMILDVEAMHWSSVPPDSVALPSPRRCHTLCASSGDDGKRLWLFGGTDGQKTLNDLWLYDVERRSWTIPICGGAPPAPREMHCCTTIKHYLVVAGGVDGSQRFHDIHVLDTNRMVWELLDDGAEYTAIMPWRSRAQYNCFFNGRLFRLKPNRDEVIDELEIVDFSLPDDLEELQRARNRKEENEDTIEISDALVFPYAIEVYWKAPLKLMDRIDRFKLMMSNSTGVVKEVCQGHYDRFRVTGLTPNSDYVFCVKAIFDDGTSLWSDSRVFQTRFTTESKSPYGQHFKP